jgi:putative transposase
MIKQEKTPTVRSLSRKETKSRRSSMVIKVLSFNIQKNKLSRIKKSYLNLLRLEAKYYYNYLIYLSEQYITDDFGSIVYPNNLFEFNTKSDLIQVFNHFDNTQVYYELKVLSSQVKQELLKKIQSSIKAISAAKSKGRKTGKLKFKSLVNIPLKQFNNSFYLSDDAKKLSLQGNKKTSFHLIRNKNLSKLCKELNLDNKGKISLKKLIDLKIIEIANAEIAVDFNDKFVLNLTVYFNHEYLKKANLFQGTNLSQDHLNLMQSIKIGNDAGIASEITINCGETYSSIGIDSRKIVNKNQQKLFNNLDKYQRRFNRHISQSKKNRSHGKLIRNNDNGFRTNTYYELKSKIDKIQSSLNNHKLDSIRKITSIFDLFKQITFQDEMVKSWHSNKKMRFSRIIQKGILGKTYAKLKNQYDSDDNKIEYKYKKLSKNLRTTKTCICGNVNNNITLKDRVYSCPQCSYENDRDTHSSYIINNTLNHIEYQQAEVLGCGKQSKNLVLDSNLGQITTNAKTEMIYQILSSKLKSQNLSLKLNVYNSLKDKSNQEAPSFRSV